jgi:hypothetical protein
VCVPGQQPAVPASVPSSAAEALAAVEAGLGFLAAADVADWPVDALAGCPFHHLIAVHRWGWTLALNPDGTTTATSPDGKRVFHSHGPPEETAA